MFDKLDCILNCVFMKVLNKSILFCNESESFTMKVYTVPQEEVSILSCLYTNR